MSRAPAGGDAASGLTGIPGRPAIGTAGWSIPPTSAHLFGSVGTHLERYARTFSCVEINSSFYRPHASATYERWAASTPPAFRFAVKLPRAITHEQLLRRPGPLLDRFLTETSGLGDKRGPILVQLPPSLAFDARVAGRFFDAFRARNAGLIACEPRHPTWFGAAASSLLERVRVARVAADPARAPGGDTPAGWTGCVYFRLHGSPRIYWSRYGDGYLRDLADRWPQSADVWCVFDNTAAGAAVENAAELQRLLWPSSGAVLASASIKS